MKYRKEVLDNGLRVLFVPMQDAFTATVFTIVGTGSRYENEKENGLAHFLEHMFFKGTKNRPTAMEISRELDALGASYNAYTGQNQTAYYAKVSSDKIMNALDVMNDLFLNSILSEDEIKKESGTIVQEINMYEDMPAVDIHNVFEELLYGKNHPLGRPVLGPKENILSFRRDDFLKYLNRCYTSKNTAIVVAGKFPEDEVFEKIKTDFSSMRTGKKPDFKIFNKTQNEPKVSIKEKKTDQTHILLGVHTPGYDYKYRYALNILTHILGGGMSSRLFTEIREKRGLAYNVKAMTEFHKDTGVFAVQAGVEHENLKKVVELILEQLRDVVKNGVTEEEFNRVKSGFAGKISFGYETSDDIAQKFGIQEVVRDEIVLPEEILNRINNVKIEEVRQVAKELFVNDSLNLAIVGPHNDKTKSEILDVLKF